MSDMSKKSDVAAPIDDVSPVPAAPFSITADVPAVDPNSPDNLADDAATEKEASPRWHPAWDSVQEKFEAILEEYDGNNVVQFKDLPAEDFKIKVLAQQVVRNEIKKIMEDTQRAVESVEQRPKRAKDSNSK